jgi:hypothetical protein
MHRRVGVGLRLLPASLDVLVNRGGIEEVPAQTVLTGHLVGPEYAALSVVAHGARLDVKACGPIALGNLLPG